MSAALDAYVTRALLRVCGADGRARGTAFRIHPSGILLTCHHVIRDLGTVYVAAEGCAPVVGRCTRGDRFPSVDLAVIHTSLTGPALPIASHNQGQTAWWTKGYGWQAAGMRSAVLAQGQLPYSQYHLRQVYALGGHSSLDGGVSGAPLLDPDSGVVTGVVNTRYLGSASLAGFVLSLEEAMTIPQIGELVAKNRAAVASWGRYLNSVAARDVCEWQVQLRLNSMETSRQVLKDAHFARPGLDSVVRAFLSSDAVLLPLYGLSGYGKTVQLVNLARTRRYPCVLLLGARLRKDECDLQDALAAELENVKTPFGRVTPELLARAFASYGKSLVVLLDGLNEGPKDLRRKLRDWIESSCTWAADMQVKIILSSRPELWRLVERHVARHFVWSDPRRTGISDLAGTEVGELSIDEADAALEAYGLMDRGIKHHDVACPFMLRLYKELERTSSFEGRLGCYRALELFVDGRCAAIAMALGGELTNSRVRRLLRGLAYAIPPGGDGRLTSDQLERVSTGVVGLASALIDENVLIEIPDGIRFAFDQVADFLRAETVEPTAVTGFAIETIREGSDSCLAQAEFALIGLALRKPHSFARAVDRLLSFAGQSTDGDVQRRCAQVMTAVFAGINEPAAFLPQLQRWAELVAGRRFAGTEASIVSRLDLPTEARLALLRTLVRTDYGRPAEKGILDFYRQDHWVMSYVMREVEKNPSEALPQLASWLSDVRPLRDSLKVNIEHVARLIMRSYVDLAPSELFDALSCNPVERSMLCLLGRSRPDLAEAQSERLVSREDNPSIEAALVCAGGALEATSDMAIRNGLLAVVREARHRGDALTSVNALGVLLCNQETVLDVLEDGLIAVGQGGLGPHCLRLAARNDPAVVAPRLLDIAMTRPQDRESVLRIVMELPLSEEVEAALIDLLP